MDRVTIALLAGLASGIYALPMPCSADPVDTTDAAIDRWQPLIAEAARRFGIPEAWIRAVIQAESGGRTMLDGRPITSVAGAIGLMQVMPETYEELRQRYGLGPDPDDPPDNISAGTAYLRELYERYGYPGLFAAYNAGPGRYDDYLEYSRALPAETLAYLKAIGQPGFGAPAMPAVASGESLFFPLHNVVPTASSGPASPGSANLFVPFVRGSADAP